MFLKFTISILLILFSLSGGQCQPDSISLKRIYEKEVIYFSGNKYVKNNITYPIRNLINEFQKDTEGFYQFQMYKSDLRKSRIYAFTGLCAYVTGLVISNRNNKAALGLVAGSIIPGSITIHIGIRADKKMKKAVWLRNRDVLIH